jgi:hypothetical protein
MRRLSHRGAGTKRPSPTFRPERLMEMVRGDTGADVDLQIEALQARRGVEAGAVPFDFT